MKIILYVLFLLPVFGNPLFAADKLDGITGSTKLINDLKDVYRAYKIYHIIADQKEMINLLADEGTEDLNNGVTSFILANKKLTTTNITDKKLKMYVDSFLYFTQLSYTTIKTKGFDSKEFKSSYEKYLALQNRYMTYLTTHFALDNYVKMSEDDYWKTIDKALYIKSDQYAKYTALKRSDIAGSRKMLENIVNQTTNFQERSIYQLEIADQYVKYDSVTNDAKTIAINMYKSILDQRKYCLYLYEAWLKWRMVYQYENGLSKSSEIPNNLYDSLREETAFIILNQVNADPGNEMAINQFLVVVSHDIVRRFGKYPYGNQITIEYHETFDDPK